MWLEATLFISLNHRLFAIQLSLSQIDEEVRLVR